MGSKIEWTDRSDWNPVRGCTRVSRGCGGPGDQGGCYAEALAARFSKPGLWGHGFAEMVKGRPRWTGKVELQEDRLLMPLSWRKPAKVFANSTSDLFHESLPDEALDKLFAVMALCPQHTFQVLTKRADRMRAYLSAARAHPVGMEALEITLNAAARDPRSTVGAGVILQGDIAHLKVWPLPNVWLGVSTERQQEADERIPLLLQTPAAIRFISAEPLLGPIDLTRINLGVKITRGYGPRRIEWDALTGWEHQYPADSAPGCYHLKSHVHASGQFPPLNWVITGAESGPCARPMHPAWPRQLRDQCAAAGVPFFFKQWGAYQPSEHAPGVIEARGPQTIAWPDGSIGPGSAAENGGPGQTLYRMTRTEKEHRRLDGREHNEFPAELVRHFLTPQIAQVAMSKTPSRLTRAPC